MNHRTPPGISTGSGDFYSCLFIWQAFDHWGISLTLEKVFNIFFLSSKAFYDHTLNNLKSLSKRRRPVNGDFFQCSIMCPQCITRYPGQCSPYPLLVLHIKVSLKVLFLSKTGTIFETPEWCLLEELFLTWIMWILPLKGRTISQWAPFLCVLLPHSIIIQDEQAHFFLWIKKKYVFTVLIRLQGQSNLQIKHQQKGKTIKIQINSIN